jgi:ligand-binding sensor domain-containing protein/signal transduction histidine kinase
MWTSDCQHTIRYRPARRARWWSLALLLWPLLARAEQLPIKVFTTADGLSQNTINRIVRDSRGFLWFCTGDGLSRYDGHSFVTFGIEQGLPHRRVNDLLETRDGEYWVATGGGLCLFDPKGEPTNHPASGQPMFTVFQPGHEERSKVVTRLWQDRTGTLWCGTQRGLFRVDRTDKQVSLTPIDVGLPMQYPEGGWIYTFAEDRFGKLWIGTTTGLFVRWPDGRAAHYTKREGLPDIRCFALLADRAGSLWVSLIEAGLYRLDINAPDAAPLVTRAYTTRDGLSNNWIFDCFQAADGKIWVSNASKVLYEFLPDGDGHGLAFRSVPPVNGIGHYEIETLAEDAAGNLWLGTNRAGALRLARNGFTTYGEADGFSTVTSIFANARGALLLNAMAPIAATGRVLTEQERLQRPNFGFDRVDTSLGSYDGRQFHFVRPSIPMQQTPFSFGEYRTVVADRAGEWWICSSDGLYRYAPLTHIADLASARAKNHYTVKDGLASKYSHHLFEDRRGDIWVSLFSTTKPGLSRWERATGRLLDMAQCPGWPGLPDRVPSAFCEDRAGNLWIGFSWGGLARYRDGRFTFFTKEDGLPAGWIYDLHTDSAGRLWIASSDGGLARVDEPGAERPAFRIYTTADGLSSLRVRCLAEDRFGHLYIGTGRGLDRLDPATGRIKHFTSADGLPAGEVRAIFHDRQGVLWLGSLTGLARYTPEPDPPPAPPPILLSGLRISGTRQTISVLGETAVTLPALAADQNQLQVEFLGLGFALGESLRYQHKLEGADADWSDPTAERTVNYARLSPGTYRFLVRAVNADGAMSAQAATLSFTILRPVWLRWWFLTLVTFSAGLLVYAAVRYRFEQRLAVERVRTRLATDLHDDIGASLSEVAVLSEVIKRRVNQSLPVAEPLALIGEVSSEMLDAMNDIVWANNPRYDSLRDLTQRLRHFTLELLEARDIAFTLSLPDDDVELQLSAELRQHVFLIGKEAVNNLARHSGATRAEIDLIIADGWLTLRISDNGCGFKPEAAAGGNGLKSMQARAAELDGELTIAATPGKGTKLHLRVPLTRRRKFSHLFRWGGRGRQ